MSIYRAVPNPHVRVSALIMLGLVAGILLAGCNFQQRQPEGTPQGGAGGAATQAVVQPTPVLGAAEPTGGAPVSTTVAPAGSPTINATSEADDPLATEVDQDLQQLDNLNNSADQLTDQP